MCAVQAPNASFANRSRLLADLMAMALVKRRDLFVAYEFAAHGLCVPFGDCLFFGLGKPVQTKSISERPSILAAGFTSACTLVGKRASRRLWLRLLTSLYC
jgi:hypothetical protein